MPSHEDRLSSGNCFFCLDKGHRWLSRLQRQRCCTKDFCWTKEIISVCCSSAIWTLALGFVSLRLSPVECLGRACGNSSRRLLSRLNCRPAWLTCKYFTKHCEFFASPSHRAPALQFSSRARVFRGVREPRRFASVSSAGVGVR